MVAHTAGERRWLNEDEEARREALATRFVETDPWEDRVLEFSSSQERIRTADVLVQALDVPIGKLSRRDEMRVTGILKRAGYRPERPTRFELPRLARTGRRSNERFGALP